VTRALVIVFMLGAGAIARADDLTADARDDVVDIRHHRMPTRHAVLGWTADGAAVIRRTDCGWQDGSGFPFCDVTISIVRADRPAEVHPLLSLGRDDEGECCAIDTGTAMAFIRGEAALRAQLGPLAPGIAQVAGFRIGDAPLALQVDDGVTGRLVASRGGDVVMATMWDRDPDGDTRTRAATITDVVASQDGVREVVLVREDTGGGDFFATAFHATVLAVPTPRAWAFRPPAR
jgi:hypothetical protein